ncbi:methyltransferase domain-containing protein [Candidatus Woesearchaeota archaeon]|nr:methyltransferase domain-containing protein [Candidatus Woesearchaeota archaeon]
MENNENETKLKKMLNLLWLRPENALLDVYKSNIFSDFKFESPSLDLSCGDGLFMFLHLGGELDQNFDYFQSTKAKEFKHDSFVDIYDDCKKEYSVDVTKPAKQKIDYGSDWKEGLLNKASKLGIYNQTILHDNNNLPLPFKDNELKTIYSNSIYWVNDINAILKDINRILKPGGIAGLEVMTPYFLETLGKLKSVFSKEAIDILDRKRSETMPCNLTYSEWKDLFIQNGFKIKEVRNVYPNKLLLDIWNVGLRPISHLLIQMSDSLSEEKRAKIKEEWVDIFFKLLKPLLSMEKNYSLEDSPYLMFILEK